MSAENIRVPATKTKRVRSVQRVQDASVGHGQNEVDSIEKSAGNRMPRIALKFTRQEIDLLISLASDQLFRREFIDPRLPGYRSDLAELNLGKQLVARLRLTTNQGQRPPLAKKNGAAN